MPAKDNWSLLTVEDWCNLLEVRPEFREKCADEALLVAADALARDREARECPDSQGEDERSSDEPVEHDSPGEDWNGGEGEAVGLVEFLDRKPDDPERRRGDDPEEWCDFPAWGASAWIRLLEAHPERADLFWNWAPMLSGDVLVEILDRFPRFASRIPGGLLDGWDWAELVVRRPELAPRCDWNALSGAAVVRVFSDCPEIADAFEWNVAGDPPWNRLDDGDWGRLLAARPAFFRFLPPVKRAFTDPADWPSSLQLDTSDWVSMLLVDPGLSDAFEGADVIRKAWISISGPSLTIGHAPVDIDGPKPESEPTRKHVLEMPFLVKDAPVLSDEMSGSARPLEITISVHGRDDGRPGRPAGRGGPAVIVVDPADPEASGVSIRDDGPLFPMGTPARNEVRWVRWAVHLGRKTVWETPRGSVRWRVPIDGDFDPAKLVLPFGRVRTGGFSFRVLLVHRISYDGCPVRVEWNGFESDVDAGFARIWDDFEQGSPTPEKGGREP